MGFVPVPKQPLNIQNWQDAFTTLSRNSDFLLHHFHLDWEDCLDEKRRALSPNYQSLRFISAMARKNGLKLFVVIDPLSTDRRELDPKLPDSFRRSFSDPKIRQAFLISVLTVAREFTPEYLGLGSEVNTYFLSHPEDIESYVSLYKEAYRIIKIHAPKIKVTVTFQFESLSGTAGKMAHWGDIGLFEPDIDAVGITTYPSLWFVDPGSIPVDYYSRLKHYTKRPILIAESGWPSGGKRRYHGSPASQEEFIYRLVELFRDMDLRLWVWWFLHDWESSGYPDFFKTMGLKRSNGVPKPAFYAWRNIFRFVKSFPP